MDPSFAERNVNEGFSGGEKKRHEILQMELLRPGVAILDETDSGLDVDALKVVSEGVNRVRAGGEVGVLLITHYTRILRYIEPDFVHVFVDGRIAQQGGPELADELEENGYIRRYSAIVDRRKVGLMVCCHAHVTLNRHAAGVVEEFENAIQLRDEVIECYETTGNSDYLIKVVVPDMEAYQAFLHDVLFKLKGVGNINTAVALREVKYTTALPL